MAVIEETPQSLRLYFGLVAAFSLFSGCVALWQARGSAIGLGLGAANIGLGLVFGYIVYRFVPLLTHRPRLLKGALIANVTLSVAIFVLASLAGGMLHALFRLAIAVAIFVYLMKSVDRLAKEH